MALSFHGVALVTFFLECSIATVLCFHTLEEEKVFVDSIINNATVDVPHGDMLFKHVNMFIDVYQLLGIDQKVVYVPAHNGESIIVLSKFDVKSYYQY